MSAPVPIKIIKPVGQEIEIAGVRYVQRPYDQPYPAKHPCHWCVASSNLSLCDLLCPYCCERMVFAKKNGETIMAQITIPLPTMQHWRTTLFGIITAAGGAIVQYWQNGGLSWRECAVAAIWAGACYLMADGQGAATKEQLAGAVQSLVVSRIVDAKPIDGGPQA